MGFSAVSSPRFSGRRRRKGVMPAPRPRPRQQQHRRRQRQRAPAPISKAEVEAIIAKIEADRGVKYNWKQSIVDLMKLLDLDSSLAARKELAQELGYKGALDGSAEMNIWLHKQVMEKLAEGGGKVPDSLKD